MNLSHPIGDLLELAQRGNLTFQLFDSLAGSGRIDDLLFGILVLGTGGFVKVVPALRIEIRELGRAVQFELHSALEKFLLL